MKASEIDYIYKKLLKTYGYQGWWPILTKKNQTGFNNGGYHQKNYDIPDQPDQKYEIILGAVLTQNTSWKNVTKALINLIENDICRPSDILEISTEKLAQTIKSSGYYNQKARKIKIITKFLIDGNYLNGEKIPDRNDLLSLWGIGPETADSILLYAYKSSIFVIDAYTMRIFGRLGIIDAYLKYDSAQKFFTDNFSGNVNEINEYHALIVRHAKEFCRKKPLCKNCPLEFECDYLTQNKKNSTH